MIYLWSDTHFNHKAIIKYCNRPYTSVEEMNENLIFRWNASISDSDDIYLVGDFAFSRKDTPTIAEHFKRLKGHKHLIIGNHDEANPKVLALPWETKDHLRTVKENGMSAVLCHYPLESWAKMGHGRLMLHGHSHGNLKHIMPHRFDVGADCHATPLALSVFWAAAQEQKFEATDHHGEDL